MRRNVFNQYIKENDFKGLFINEMGWNRFHGQADIQPIEVDGNVYKMKTIAELKKQTSKYLNGKTSAPLSNELQKTKL